METITNETDSSQTKKPTIEKQVQRKIFKIIVIGDSNVGKTCLTFRFCAGKFPEKPEATIGVDFREKTVQVDGEIIKLQLWDTAGQERFRKSMVPHYYRNVHAVVFVYDVTKASSFESLSGWIEECDQHSLDKNVPRILVGNKSDLGSTESVAVSIHVAQRFADRHNMPLFETSAKDDKQMDHVESIFMTLAHKLKNAKHMMPPEMAGYGYGSGEAATENGGVVTVGHATSRTNSKDTSGGCGC